MLTKSAGHSKLFRLIGEVAQSAEQRTHKPWVEGSSPSLAIPKAVIDSLVFYLFDIIGPVFNSIRGDKWIR